jgi:hypothetical protein
MKRSGRILNRAEQINDINVIELKTTVSHYIYGIN